MYRVDAISEHNVSASYNVQLLEMNVGPYLFFDHKAWPQLLTVPCNETRLFGIFPYKLVIFTYLKDTLNVLEKLSFFHDFFKIV